MHQLTDEHSDSTARAEGGDHEGLGGCQGTPR